MEKLPLLLYGCILGMVIMALVFYLDMSSTTRPGVLRQEDERSTQKIGFLIMIVLFATFLIVVVNKLRGESDEGRRSRRSSDNKRSNDSMSDSRSQGSIPPGVRPRPTLTPNKFREQIKDNTNN